MSRIRRTTVGVIAATIMLLGAFALAASAPPPVPFPFLREADLRTTEVRGSFLDDKVFGAHYYLNRPFPELMAEAEVQFRGWSRIKDKRGDLVYSNGTERVHIGRIHRPSSFECYVFYERPAQFVDSPRAWVWSVRRAWDGDP